MLRGFHSIFIIKCVKYLKEKGMNYLWGGMLLLGVIYGVATGNMQSITEAALDSSKEAVTLAISIAGVTAFWTGILNIAKKGGMVEKLSAKMGPLIRFLFPHLPADHPAKDYIAMNMIANVLGLGSAATPIGLQAMDELSKLEEDRRKGELSGPRRKRGIASNEMCTFLIINISSLQLIPVNVIAYRSQYGSVNPAAIVGPGIVATAVSTIVAIIFCKIMDGKRGV